MGSQPMVGYQGVYLDGKFTINPSEAPLRINEERNTGDTEEQSIYPLTPKGVISFTLPGLHTHQSGWVHSGRQSVCGGGDILGQKAGESGTASGLCSLTATACSQLPRQQKKPTRWAEMRQKQCPTQRTW